MNSYRISSTRRSASSSRRRSGSSYHQHDRHRDYTTTNSYHPRFAVASEGGDCELGGGTTILQHTPGHSPLRIIDRGRISSAAVCHTHPSRKDQSVGPINGDETPSNKSARISKKMVRPASATGGGTGISATAAAAVVAAATTTSFATSCEQNNTNDVEL